MVWTSPDRMTATSTPAKATAAGVAREEQVSGREKPTKKAVSGYVPRVAPN